MRKSKKSHGGKSLKNRRLFPEAHQWR
jgi:hypothetical protein